MKSLIRTIEENCVGCNKCMLGCPVEDANIAYWSNGENKILIDINKCINCGRCIEECDHNARAYLDDTELFIKDLEKGTENISVIIAPAIKTTFPEYKRLIGLLKSMGVKNAYEVSLGADIATWAYLKILKDEKVNSVLAQPCPAVVNYIEKYQHNLIDKLIPIQSPMVCLGIYLKKYLGINNKICFLSPCIAKGSEIHDESTENIISYNVTIKNIVSYMERENISLEDFQEEDVEHPSKGIGDLFSTPGGMRENINFYDPTVWVQHLDGTEYIYDYLTEYEENINKGLPTPKVVDLLNCHNGCSGGSAICKNKGTIKINRILNEFNKKKLVLTGEEAKKILLDFDEKLKIEDFKRNYKVEYVEELKEPNEKEYEDIYRSMLKTTAESRNKNCNACGYRSCKHMARAIYNGVNFKENCIDNSSKIIKFQMHSLEEQYETMEYMYDKMQEKSDELDKMNKRLIELDSIKSDFISTVSHELRTPLTSVLGFAKIIKKKLEEVVIPEMQSENKKVIRTMNQIKDNVDIIVSEGQRLTSLINDVLDIAKMESGKTEWKKDPVSIEDIIDRATKATLSLFLQKKLKLEKNIAENIPVFLGDSDRLIQVVINLLSNSIKFTDEGTITCEAKVENNSIVVSVTDTGIGIAESDLESVFEKFKQVGETLTDKPKGTGLGLPICKEIIEHHKGKIWTESVLGEGSKFIFTIPLANREEDNNKIGVRVKENVVKQLKEHLNNVIPMDANSKCVLVVDDEASIRSLLRQEFEDEGYTVIEAENGMEAMEQIRLSKPDIVILDVMMPVMNGFEVADAIKKNPDTKDIPVIILSIIEDREQGKRIGVDGYLTKPIDINALFKEVEDLLVNGKMNRKVLVVNEDEPAVETLIQALQVKGYNVAETHNYKDYLDEAQAEMILVDKEFYEHYQVSRALKFQKELEEVLVVIYSEAENNKK